MVISSKIKEHKKSIIKIIVNFCSLSVAAIFIFSGFTKAVDPVGGGIKIGEYLYSFGVDVMNDEALLASLSMLQSIIEFLIGVYLLFGIHRKFTSLVLTVVMSFMTLLTLYIAKTDAVSNCGCFGDAISLGNWPTFYKNTIIMLATIVIVSNADKINKLIRVKNEWIIEVYSFIAVIAINIYSYHYLPIVDFRPYYIGQNIVKGMDIPIDAESPVYETVFTLQKGEIQKKFTLENYPDSTWTFVDSKTKIINPGFQPEISGFGLYDYITGEDVTSYVLDKSYTFWLVMPHIENADNGVLDAVEDIYDYCKLNDYNLIGLSSSDNPYVEEWKHGAGIDFPFYHSDDITLKTIVRSNPGLLLVHHGEIINKWSKNNLPDEEVLTERLEKLTSIYGKKENGLRGAFKYLCFFIIPPIFLIFAEKYRVRLKWIKIKTKRL